MHAYAARPSLECTSKTSVIMRILSSTLPRRAAYFSDGTTLSYCSWPPLWPRCAVSALLKTRNQLNGFAPLGIAVAPPGHPVPEVLGKEVQPFLETPRVQQPG